MRQYDIILIVRSDFKAEDDNDATNKTDKLVKDLEKMGYTVTVDQLTDISQSAERVLRGGFG